MQQVSETEELEHDAAPVVEQPELIRLNRLTGSAGLKKGEAKVEPTKALKTKEASIIGGQRWGIDVNNKHQRAMLNLSVIGHGHGCVHGLSSALDPQDAL